MALQQLPWTFTMHDVISLKTEKNSTPRIDDSTNQPVNWHWLYFILIMNRSRWRILRFELWTLQSNIGITYYSSRYAYIYAYMYMYIHMCVRVCVRALHCRKLFPSIYQVPHILYLKSRFLSQATGLCRPHLTLHLKIIIIRWHSVER